MWIFTEQGLLMPAAIPFDKVDPKYLKPGYDLQVRGRVLVHLQRWAEKYMPEGSYSEIQVTPELDYNCRFYCSHDDLAWAMGRAIADIDYKKFKPVVEKPEYGEEGKEYHKVLNAIWGTVTALGSPGGWWGAYSETNPKGYKASEFYSRYGLDKPSKSKYTSNWGDSPLFSEHAGYNWSDYIPDNEGLDVAPFDSHDLDWQPTSEEEAQFILDDLKKAQIPTSEWRDSCTEDEWIAIRSYFDREVKREKREAKRAQRRSRRHSHSTAA